MAALHFSLLVFLPGTWRLRRLPATMREATGDRGRCARRWRVGVGKGVQAACLAGSKTEEEATGTQRPSYIPGSPKAHRGPGELFPSRPGQPRTSSSREGATGHTCKYGAGASAMRLWQSRKASLGAPSREGPASNCQAPSGMSPSPKKFSVCFAGPGWPA